MHQVIEAVLPDVLPVLEGEESSPFTDLEDDQVDEVDDGDDEGEKE
jgi:hypothetical protein